MESGADGFISRMKTVSFWKIKWPVKNSGRNTLQEFPWPGCGDVWRAELDKWGQTLLSSKREIWWCIYNATSGLDLLKKGRYVPRYIASKRLVGIVEKVINPLIDIDELTLAFFLFLPQYSQKKHASQRARYGPHGRVVQLVWSITGTGNSVCNSMSREIAYLQCLQVESSQD